VITADEFVLMKRRGELRDKVIRVDDFPYDFGLRAALAEIEPNDSRPLRAVA